jgi:hypothetical protein
MVSSSGERLEREAAYTAFGSKAQPAAPATGRLLLFTLADKRVDPRPPAPGK